MNIERKDSPNVLPSTERIQAGGAESNRGFRENTLGPVFVTGDKQEIFDGGSRRGLYRLELRYQIINDTFAVTTFLDSSNSSFSSGEERIIRQEFADSPVTEGESAPQFADNEPYPFEAVFTHPRYLWTKNYLSYGLALNYLTPLGSVNLSFGWPWQRCLNGESSCPHPRGNSSFRKLSGAVIGLNIGANF
jgi:outer membrane protein assembly factor BamA